MSPLLHFSLLTRWRRALFAALPLSRSASAQALEPVSTDLIAPVRDLMAIVSAVKKANASARERARQDKVGSIDPTQRPAVRVKIVLQAFFEHCDQAARQDQSRAQTDEQALYEGRLRIAQSLWPKWSPEELLILRNLTREAFFDFSDPLPSPPLDNNPEVRLSVEPSVLFTQLRLALLDERTCTKLCEFEPGRQEALLAIAQHRRLEPPQDSNALNEQEVLPLSVWKRVFRTLPEVADWVHAQATHTLWWMQDPPPSGAVTACSRQLPPGLPARQAKWRCVNCGSTH